jgi:hypothetical protein
MIKKLIIVAGILSIVGCATPPPPIKIMGSPPSVGDPRINITGGVSTKERVARAELEAKFGFDVNLIQPNAVGATINTMTSPIDYLQNEHKGSKIKLSVNAHEKCLCLFV